jgi:hypothetical protein
VKLPSQRFKSNEMPVAPDRVCPIRRSPVFLDCSTVESERFRAARSRPQSGGHSGQVSPIEASTSRTSATAPSGAEAPNSSSRPVPEGVHAGDASA